MISMVNQQNIAKINVPLRFEQYNMYTHMKGILNENSIYTCAYLYMVFPKNKNKNANFQQSFSL